MQLYTIISIAVVILTTSALYIILRRQNMNDYRYHLGLGISAVTAVVASLFLPGLMIVFTRDLLLKLAVSFFIALLAYITLLFLVMMLVMSFFTKKKMEMLHKKWSEKRLARKNAAEQKQKMKDEARAEATKKSQDEQESEAKPSEPGDKHKKLVFNRIFTKKSSEPEFKSGSEKTQGLPEPEKAEKTESVNEADTQHTGLTEHEEIPADNEKPSEPEKSGVSLSENEADIRAADTSAQDDMTAGAEEPSKPERPVESISGNEADIRAADTSAQDDMTAGAEEPSEPDQPEEASVEFEQAGEPVKEEEIPELVWQEQAVSLPKPEKSVELFFDSVAEEEAVCGYDEPENLAGDKTIHEEGFADFAVPDESVVPEMESTDSPVQTIGQPYGSYDWSDVENIEPLPGNTGENEQKTEKNVDTSIIIDKMGLDMIAEQVIPDLDDSETDLNGIIESAFRLKREGREIEAASLYMEALNKKPDSETVFNIVLDICVIYKNAGLTELAEDILQCYMNEFEGIMSVEVKEQILQNLYS